MTDTDLITALRRIAVQDQHRCLGCGYEHNCGIHGCQIIRAAADRLKELAGKDSNVPTKTADEMFRELGFIKSIEDSERTGCTVYVKGCRLQLLVVIDEEGSVLSCFRNDQGEADEDNEVLEKGVVLACAQLIKEMRESM